MKVSSSFSIFSILQFHSSCTCRGAVMTVNIIILTITIVIMIMINDEDLIVLKMLLTCIHLDV